jgi:hypothetical protein
LAKTNPETRLENLTTRFSFILQNQINYNVDTKEAENSRATKSLVKTKFSSDNGYLWNKCKYFLEAEENFYVKLFLDSGKFLVGHQLFIDKTDEVI